MCPSFILKQTAPLNTKNAFVFGTSRFFIPNKKKKIPVLAPKRSQKQHLCNYCNFFFPAERDRLRGCGFETPSSAPADPPVRRPFRHGVRCQALFKPTELHFEFQSRSRSFQRHRTCQAELQLNVQAAIHMTCCIFSVFAAMCA